MSGEDKKKLRTLLSYLVEHNREHSQEVKEWAEKAEGLGEGGIAREMLEAAEAMDRAVGLLSEALEKLGEV